MTDSRAFGYIFGSPDTGHRFFGIKTDKAANQVVIAMRDLFQVVFELKKKEIEMAKQHIEQNVVKFHTSGIFVEPAPDTKGAAETENCHQHQRSLSIEIDKSVQRNLDTRNGVIADLLDLQFELNSLQQGIHQMDKITPENCPLPSEDPFEADPFGDSFINIKIKDAIRPILPPPPPSAKRGIAERQHHTEQISSPTITSPTATIPSSVTLPSGSLSSNDAEKKFTDFEVTKISNSNAASSDIKDEEISLSSFSLQNNSPQIDVFTELDPLGTGLSKPYVDKKDFFQNLKNPPKKILKDLVGSSLNDIFPTSFHLSINSLDPIYSNNDKQHNLIECNNFADFEHFEASDDLSSKEFSLLEEKSSVQNQNVSGKLSLEECTNTRLLTNTDYKKFETEMCQSSKNVIQSLNQNECNSTEKQDFDIDVPVTSKVDRKSFSRELSNTNDSPASPLRSCSSEANSRLSSSSAELECVPEPPPRNGKCLFINPPPLPPKKQPDKIISQPPPIPLHIENHLQYDIIRCEKVETSVKKVELENMKLEEDHQYDDKVYSSLLRARELKETVNTDLFFSSKLRESIKSITPLNLSSILQNSNIGVDECTTKSVLNSTLSELASANLTELAASLNMTVSELTNLTLQQLTKCLANYSLREIHPRSYEEITIVPPSSSENNKSKHEEKKSSGEYKSHGLFLHDKYAVIREILENDRSQSENNQGLEKQVNDFENKQLNSHKNQNRDHESKLTLNTGVNDDSLFYQTPNDSNEQMNETSFLKKEKNQEDKNNVDILNNKNQSTKPKIKENIYKHINRPKCEEHIQEQNQSFISDHKENENEIINEVETTCPLMISNDKYAALREIISQVESINTEFDKKSDTCLQILDQSTTMNADEDLMNLFSTPQSPSLSVTKVSEKPSGLTENVVTRCQVFEKSNKELILKNVVESHNVGFDDVFHSFPESRQTIDKSENDENWAKFDINACQSGKLYDSHNSLEGNSPWSPEEREFQKLPRTITPRHYTESDNEWREDDENEESSEKFSSERFYSGKKPMLDAGCENIMFYDDAVGMIEKERYFRGRMNKKSYEGLWTKCGHRVKSESMPWYDEGKWEEEHRKCASRKIYFDDDNHRISHWKCCNSQALPWNGERSSYSGKDHILYDKNRRDRRLKLWKEDDRDRDRFSSQESMDYDEEERWPRHEFERRRREEDSRFWERYGALPESDYSTLHRKYNHHYFRDGGDHLQLDYSLGWEKEYHDRIENSRRHTIRKRYWPKRPNSANDDRNTDLLYQESNISYGISRSECSDNDSECYRLSCRPRSREQCWSNDQELDSWNVRTYPSEGPSMMNSTNYCKKTNRYKPPPKNVIKSRKSPFEDDFIQNNDYTRSSVLVIDRDTNIDLNVLDANKISSLKSKGEKLKKNKVSEQPSEFNDGSIDITGSDETTENNLNPNSKFTRKENCYDVKDSFVAMNRSNESHVHDTFPNGNSKNSVDASALKSIITENLFDTSCESTSTFSKQLKHGNNKTKEVFDIKKSESINIFVRENDPFDDDEFFN
ncbi:DAB adaptor protein isoform X2 [Cotesia typhae]